MELALGFASRLGEEEERLDRRENMTVVIRCIYRAFTDCDSEKPRLERRWLTVRSTTHKDLLDDLLPIQVTTPVFPLPNRLVNIPVHVKVSSVKHLR